MWDFLFLSHNFYITVTESQGQCDGIMRATL